MSITRAREGQTRRRAAIAKKNKPLAAINHLP